MAHKRCKLKKDWHTTVAGCAAVVADEELASNTKDKKEDNKEDKQEDNHDKKDEKGNKSMADWKREKWDRLRPNCRAFVWGHAWGMGHGIRNLGRGLLLAGGWADELMMCRDGNKWYIGVLSCGARDSFKLVCVCLCVGCTD